MKRKKGCMPPLERVKADLAAGLSNLEMEEAYGVNISTITHFLSKNGLRRRPKPVMPSDEQLLECLNAKMTLYAMAKHFGLSHDTIRRLIDKGQLRRHIETPTTPPIVMSGLEPSAAKVIITAIDGSKISVPRVPFIHGYFEVRA